MTLPTWGMLEKSQTDDQTIDEAVAVAITAHLADAAAHVGAGQSLQSHAAAEIIDHLASSIVADKIKVGQLVLNHFNNTRFLSQIPLVDIDYSGCNPSSFAYPLYAEISTSGSDTGWNEAIIGGDQRYGFIGAASKNPVFRFRLVPFRTTDMEVYFGIGDFLGDGALGFKMTGGALKAVWWDDDPAEHLVAIADIDISAPHNYSVEVVNGESIKWLVDGVVVYSLAWPADITIVGGNKGLTISIRRTAGGAFVLILYQLVLEQDFV